MFKWLTNLCQYGPVVLSMLLVGINCSVVLLKFIKQVLRLVILGLAISTLLLWLKGKVIYHG